MEDEIQPGLTENLKLFRPKAKMLRSAAMLAMRLENSAVLVFTRSGDLAAKLGALRPNGAPLFASMGFIGDSGLFGVLSPS